MGEVLRIINERKGEGLGGLRITPEGLAGLLKLIAMGTISRTIAKTVFEEMVQSGKGPEEIVKAKGLTQISDSGEVA